MKYIFVTGGVVSSLGKGLTAAALGTLLENRGLKVALQKFDPYLNVDPGTMSPYQHGEVYVLDDGAETDLDLGHYERFTNCQTHPAQQPHQRPGLPDRAQQGTRGRLPRQNRPGHPARHRRNPEPDQSAGRADQGRRDHHGDRRHDRRHRRAAVPGSHPRVRPRSRTRNNALFMHVTYVPFIKAAGELKTKPTQQSVAKLREIGIAPHILVCRCERPWTRSCARRSRCSATCPTRR
jgi:CTP synthase